jgi:hypothetical protein
LLNDPTTTTDVVIRFTWSAGASDGGNSVIDHTIYSDLATGSFYEIDNGIVDLYY